MAIEFMAKRKAGVVRAKIKHVGDVDHWSRFSFRRSLMLIAAMRFIGICPVCAENHSVQQIDRLCRLIPIVAEESAMSQIGKSINSEQVSFSGQVLEDDELAAVSGGDTALETASQQMSFMMSAVDNVIKSIGEGLKSTAQKG